MELLSNGGKNQASTTMVQTMIRMSNQLLKIAYSI
jgi:hypothetical protein